MPWSNDSSLTPCKNPVNLMNRFREKTKVSFSAQFKLFCRTKVSYSAQFKLFCRTKVSFSAQFKLFCSNFGPARIFKKRKYFVIFISWKRYDMKKVHFGNSFYSLPLFYAVWGIKDGIRQCRCNCGWGFVWRRQKTLPYLVIFWNLKFSLKRNKMTLLLLVRFNFFINAINFSFFLFV